MHNLTDGQRAALLSAARRDDGAANLAKILKGAAAARVGKALIAQKLMREVKTKAGMPVWRRDGEGRTFCLVISSTGRKAVGVFKEPAKALDPAPGKAASIECVVVGPGKGANPEKASVPGTGERAKASSATPSQRAGTKKALLIEMLSSSAGTSIDALVSATGWLPHTTRAALTGLRHAGHCIERSKGEDGVSAYRLIRAPAVQGSGSAAMKGKAAAAARV